MANQVEPQMSVATAYSQEFDNDIGIIKRKWMSAQFKCSAATPADTLHSRGLPLLPVQCTNVQACSIKLLDRLHSALHTLTTARHQALSPRVE